MVYIVVAMFIFLVEMICWGLRTSYLTHRRWVWNIVDHMPQDPILMLLHHLERSLNRTNTGEFTRVGRMSVKRMLEWREDSRWTDFVDVVLRVIEVGNSTW